MVPRPGAQEVIWVAGAFIEASRLSFKRMVGINTEPFLYTVPSELESCKQLLRLLEVRESFGPIELAGMLRQLASLHLPLRASGLRPWAEPGRRCTRYPPPDSETSLAGGRSEGPRRREWCNE